MGGIRETSLAWYERRQSLGNVYKGTDLKRKGGRSGSIEHVCGTSRVEIVVKESPVTQLWVRKEEWGFRFTRGT